MSETKTVTSNPGPGMRVLPAEELETVSGGHRSPSEFVIVHHYDKASPVLM